MKGDLINWILTKDFIQILFSFTFLIISIITIFFWIIYKQKALLYYSLLNFSIFVYFFNLSDASQLIFHSPAGMILSWDLSVTALVFFTNLFFQSMYKKFTFFTYINSILLIFSVTKFLSIGINSFNEWTIVQNLLNIGILLSVPVYSFKLYYKTRVSELLYFGLIILTVPLFGFYESFSNNLQHTENTIIHWSFMLMTVFFGSIIILKFKNIELENMNLLIQNEKYSSQINEMKYNTLQSRMNPHFLFNSLNILNAYIKSKPGLAGKALQNISDHYRYLTDHTSENLVSMEKEWIFTRNYLNLLELKYEHNFEFSLKKSGNLKTTFIPPLTIQPLVENAFLHGIGNLQRKGRIRIILTADKNHNSIQITDNGAGLSADFRESRTLKNIHDRISHHYKIVESELSNNPEGKPGATVTITFSNPFGVLNNE